jgi:uncharacterized protein YdcH (DUF465 family)
MADEALNELRRRLQIEAATEAEWKALRARYNELARQVTDAKVSYDNASQDVVDWLKDQRKDLMLDHVYGDE